MSGVVSAVGPTLALGSAGGDSANDQARPPGDSMIGRVLGQNYRVVDRIGAGGMGVVYVVEHISLRKRFAAKVLNADLARHPEAIARFEVEAHSASQLDHENIVSVIDYGHSGDGTIFLIMELLRGRSLQERMRQGPLSLEEIVSILVPVCQALSAAHDAGIVHRDMKPDNVFLTERGLKRPLIKVVDFGISKVRDGSLREGRITKQGQVLGSPEYMSPEAARGDEVDSRADVYALGIMLYELVCGQVPFQSDNYLKVLQMHIGERPRPPRQLRQDIPDALEGVILTALAKHPDERFASAEEFEVHLLAALPDVAARALYLPSHTPPAGLVRPSLDAGQSGPMAQARATPTEVIGADDSTAVVAAYRGPSRRAVWIAIAAIAAIAGVAAVAITVATVDSDPPATAPAVGEPPARPAAATAPAEIAPGPVPEPPAAPEQVRLRVDSSPPGAAVTLDGRPLGQTPVDVTVDAMQTDATVVVELAGYVPEARELSLSRDALVEIALTQAAAPPGKPRRPLRKALRANPRPAGRDGRNPPQDGLGIKEDR